MRTGLRSLSFFFLVILVFASACSDTESPAEEISEEPEKPTEEADRVELDLSPYIVEEPDPEEASVRVFQVRAESQLIPGESAQGKIGDFILENERGRFLIEGADRVMNPCPYGGNVLDAESKIGMQGGDILGEICLFINGGQTLYPEHFEIVHDGGDGGAGVLAVTGRLVISDFINLMSMVDDFVPGISGRIPLDPDDILPLRVTIYYVLRPGDQGLRVLTAMRNDAEEPQHVIFSHLVASGGDGRYFNPLSSNGGYGSGSSLLSSERLPFLAFRGERSSYAYVPKPAQHLGGEELPIGGSYVVISGVAATLLGARDMLAVIAGTKKFLEKSEEVVHIEPGKVEAMEHWHFVGDGSLSTMLDHVYPTMGLDTGSVAGRVVDSSGNPVADSLVTAIRDFGSSSRTLNQSVTDSLGRFSMAVPPGGIQLVARRDGQVSREPVVLDLEPGETIENQTVGVDLRPELRVRVKTPAGKPTPARVTVICPQGGCPNAPTNNEKDVDLHGMPGRFASIGWVGVDGVVNLSVPQGEYRVVVSRGTEWSIWPPDAMTSGGHPVTLEAGKTTELEAEIARVVETPGALSADFHVHAVPSPDSPVPLEHRVLNFLSEGVDVIVSTDHDVVTDYAPAIETLRAGHEIASIIGEEITTSDLGHFNAFPLAFDADHRRHGSLDWGGGTEESLTPQEIFEWVKGQPGDQVVQVNHPDGLGLVKLADVDVLRGLSFAPRERKRLPLAEPDPVTGDTGLWSEEFTAMEVMNGTGLGRFYGVGRWWMTMIGRGFTPTGTAVTDTHKLYTDLGGVPRSYVFLPEGQADVANFDASVFSRATNEGKLIGSAGPFFVPKLRNASGTIAGLGETVANEGAPVRAILDIDLPEWMEVDTVDVYMNVPYEDLHTSPGTMNGDPLEPGKRVSFSLSDDDLVEAARGTHSHRHYRKRVEFDLTTEEDAYVVFVVRGMETPNMSPVVPGDKKPFAFSNPIYIDADGNGYDHPPYEELSRTLPSEAEFLRAQEKPDIDPHHVHFADEWSVETIQHLAHVMSCNH